MRRAARQLLVLLRVALTMDFRAGGLFRGRHSRGALAFVLTLLFYFFVGLSLAAGTAAELPLFLRLTSFLVTAGIFIAFNVLAEYQHILLSPTDVDVLYWRPIGARTLFLARLLHILVNVCCLSAVLLAAPGLDVALTLEHHRAAVWLGFCAAGFLNAVAAAAIVVLVYAWLLRYVSRERFHDVLVWMQVVMGVVVLVVYQGLDAVLEPFDLGALAIPAWVHVLPAAWWAHLPAKLAGAGYEASLSMFIAGLGVLAVVAIYAGRVLAPHYAANLVEATALDGSKLQSPESGPSGRTRIASLPRRLATAFLGRDPLRRAGFDFLLANLRGDRRLKTSLVPALALPVVYIAFGLLWSRGWDPYRTDYFSTASVAETSGEHPAGESTRGKEGAVDAGDPVAARARKRVIASVFGGTYFLVLLSVLTVRSLASSPTWRAAWVFYAAPTRRFDSFYLGVLYGAAYGLLLPAVAVVVLLLLLVWRDPLHALAHVALPLGMSALGVSALLALDPAVPFAREPLRHERALNAITSFLVLVPLLVLVFVQYALRTRPTLLVVAGVLAGLAAALCLLPVRRRLRMLPLVRPFDE